MTSKKAKIFVWRLRRGPSATISYYLCNFCHPANARHILGIPRLTFSQGHARTFYEVHVRRGVSAGRGSGHRLRIGRLEPLQQLGLQVLQTNELCV